MIYWLRADRRNINVIISSLGEIDEVNTLILASMWYALILVVEIAVHNE